MIGWIVFGLLLALVLFFQWDIRRLHRLTKHKHDWWSVELYEHRTGSLIDRDEEKVIGTFSECTAKAVCKECKAGKLIKNVEVWYMNDGTTKAFHEGKEHTVINIEKDDDDDEMR